jgi:hypothetical protein
MQARLIPDIEQIRCYAQGALGAFETLDMETAVECAMSELNALLRYLVAFDYTDNAIPVLISSGIEPRIVVEGVVSDGQK